MKSIVEHVRISSKGKEILKRLKSRTGIEHWNEICRIAYCYSLANPSPAMPTAAQDSAIDIEWKTFAGQYHLELTSITKYRANKEGINIVNNEELSVFFRSHLERGISSIAGIKSLRQLVEIFMESNRKVQ